MADKPTIGLTGGIASGKSTVARVLERLQVGVVDADQVAREVVAPGSDGLREIVAAFGPGVLSQDGSLSRERLAALAFADEKARATLQAITHPRIAARSAQRMAELRASAAPYVVYDAPLLVEVGAHKGLDGLIVVAADESDQIARAIARDATSEAEVRRRLAAQLPLERKLEAADYVIHNRGSVADLERQTLAVHDQILKHFGLEGATR